MKDVDLMRHVDGELDDAPTGEEARAKVDAIREVGELVRGHLELSADAVPQARFDAMWRAIEGARRPAAAAPGLWGRAGSWLERHRGHVITGAVSAGAVAAIALIVRPGAPDPGTRTSGTIDVQPAALRSAPVIEDLETPGGNTTVLTIEDEDGHMTMILVTPADTVEGI